jgi:hypothetical protein
MGHDNAMAAIMTGIRLAVWRCLSRSADLPQLAARDADREAWHSQSPCAGIQSGHRKAYAIQRADLVRADGADSILRKADTSCRRSLGDRARINPQLKSHPGHADSRAAVPSGSYQRWFGTS